MKQIFIILCSCMITINLQAQETLKVDSKWSVEAVFSPNFSYRLLLSSPNEQWHQSHRNQQEIGRLGYSSRLLVNHHFHERWHIGFGAGYASIGFNTKPETLSWDNAINNAPTALKTSHQYSYVGLFLVANYQVFQHQRWTSAITLGAVMNTYLDKNIETFVQQNNQWTSSSNWGFEYDRHSLFVLLGISNQYRLIDGLSLVANINFTQAVMPNSHLARTQELLNFLSLDLGLQYRFQKKKS